ncbi:MAG: hypothetical protein M3112_07395 [Actinomycetia bacterium]|nr:hypothetical protein [Actinomycetes bacterium]
MEFTCKVTDESVGPVVDRFHRFRAADRSVDSKQWESVDVEWRHAATPRISKKPEYHDGHTIIKKEILPDGRAKMILRDKDDGSFFDLIT